MRLVLIDDHPLVLQGMKAVIEGQPDMEVVGMASCGAEGLKVLQESQPDLALLDLRLPGEYGLDLVQQARPLVPDCRFIILTSYSDRADIRRAMSDKVEGYILKDAMPEEIISAIRLTGKKRTYLDPAIMQMLLSSNKGDPVEQLTARELEVLEYLAQGMSNRNIAAALFVTEYTIKKHVSQILEKLELTDRTQAALYAFSKGMGRIGVCQHDVNQGGSSRWY